MRHAAVVFGKDLDLFVVDPDRVRKPDVIADPIHFLHVPDGTMTEPLQAELFLVFGLGEMSVQMHAVFTRQFGGLFHQVAGDAERRTGRKHDLHDRAGLGVVILFDETLGVFQDGVFAIHNGIGRKSALRFAEAHRAARGLDAESDLLGGGNLIVQF